jgi:ferritin heavy chain
VEIFFLCLFVIFFPGLVFFFEFLQGSFVLDKVEGKGFCVCVCVCVFFAPSSFAKMMLQVAAVPGSGTVATLSSGIISGKRSIGQQGGGGGLSLVKCGTWQKCCNKAASSRRHDVVVRAASTDQAESKALTGVVFEPFAEVQSQLVQVSSSYTESMARQRFASSCEAAINDQIK